MIKEPPSYYVPHHAYWPLVGSVGLFTLVLGGINILHAHPTGWWFFFAGALIVAFMLFGWFRSVIEESAAGLYSAQLDRSFRWGMVWFILSEVMFFAAFFGALFYARHLSVPWMGGIGAKVSTHTVLWDHFQAAWPLLKNPDPTAYIGPKAIMSPWGIPALNTLILLSSGVTVTFAHLALKKNQRTYLNLGLLLTILLGLIFLSFQAYEYHHAYTELGLKLNSGIYGATFFMLTGFHGAHVTIGTIMLIVIFLRCLKGHFSPEKHFGFEAVAWYWHFVDVIWLMLFIFVYWL
jgi:cytochrome c oxidase subunit 3